MAAASERRLHEPAEPEAAAASARVGAVPGGGRRSRVAVVAVIVGVECAWFAAVAYAVWRLVTSI